VVGGVLCGVFFSLCGGVVGWLCWGGCFFGGFGVSVGVCFLLLRESARAFGRVRCPLPLLPCSKKTTISLFRISEGSLSFAQPFPPPMASFFSPFRNGALCLSKQGPFLPLPLDWQPDRLSHAQHLCATSSFSFFGRKQPPAFFPSPLSPNMIVARSQFE